MTKAISLWNPWAFLMAVEEKKFETRGWQTSYRGPMMIHSAKRFTRDEEHYCRIEPFRSTLSRNGIIRLTDLPFGCVLCVADLLDCIPTEKIRESLSVQERAFGNYNDGRFAWKFTNVKRFDVPIPMVGRQGLFEVVIPG